MNRLSFLKKGTAAAAAVIIGKKLDWVPVPEVPPEQDDVLMAQSWDKPGLNPTVWKMTIPSGWLASNMIVCLNNTGNQYLISRQQDGTLIGTSIGVGPIRGDHNSIEFVEHHTPTMAPKEIDILCSIIPEY